MVVNLMYRSPIGTKGLYCAWKWCRLTADGVIHETLTFKDIDLQILRKTRVEISRQWS